MTTGVVTNSADGLENQSTRLQRLRIERDDGIGVSPGARRARTDGHQNPAARREREIANRAAAVGFPRADDFVLRIQRDRPHAIGCATALVAGARCTTCRRSRSDPSSAHSEGGMAPAFRHRCPSSVRGRAASLRSRPRKLVLRIGPPGHLHHHRRELPGWATPTQAGAPVTTCDFHRNAFAGRADAAAVSAARRTRRRQLQRLANETDDAAGSAGHSAWTSRCGRRELCFEATVPDGKSRVVVDGEHVVRDASDKRCGGKADEPVHGDALAEGRGLTRRVLQFLAPEKLETRFRQVLGRDVRDPVKPRRTLRIGTGRGPVEADVASLSPTDRACQRANHGEQIPASTSHPRAPYADSEGVDHAVNVVMNAAAVRDRQAAVMVPAGDLVSAVPQLPPVNASSA